MIALLLKTIPLQGKAGCQDTIQSFYATLLEMKIPVHNFHLSVLHPVA
jgi:hypothetical protein